MKFVVILVVYAIIGSFGLTLMKKGLVSPETYLNLSLIAGDWSLRPQFSPLA